MPNNLKVPYTNPFGFIKNPFVQNPHPRQGLSALNIRENQVRALYQQKWIKSKTTKLQIESSILPTDLIAYNRNGLPLKNFEWSPIVTGIGYKIYETLFDVSDIDDQIIFLHCRAISGELINWEFYSEPIQIGSYFPNLFEFVYKNKFNKDDTAWTTGLEMRFFCEAGLREFDPKFDGTDFVSQIHDSYMIDSVPFLEGVIAIGDTRNGISGVSEYMLYIINSIFSCDTVYLGLPGGAMERYTRKGQADIKVTRNPTYPLVGGSLEIVQVINSQSLEFDDTTPLPDGFITAYNIDTDFFGPGAIMPVIEVEQNG